MRFLAVLVFLGITAAAAAQQRVDLASAWELAAAADPRVAQLRLEAAQTELRLRDLELERRPAITIEGQAQYQSQIVELPLTIPGRPKPAAPKDTFDAYVRLEQPLFDATREARIGVERARLAESEARVRTAMYGLRSEVSEAFFAAMLLQEREAQI
ncbi:MAG TPA: TolC family protein, partial [Thermoanaerobaculia bacterium]|nr:TolC family protein [Thermoanaerobaculia bacterium]